MKEPLLEGRKPWNYGRKIFNWRPDLHPRGRDGRFINVFKKLLNMNIGDSRDLSDIVADAPNIQEATAWRTRDGWEVRSRASDGTYGTKISTQDVQENDGVFDDVLQMINGLQGFPDLPLCPCGCGNKSKNGQFLYGHQERQRDALNKKAMAGDAGAMDTLADMPPEWYDGFNMPGESDKPDKNMLDQLIDEFGDPNEPEPVPEDTSEEVKDARALFRVVDFIIGEQDIRDNMEQYLLDHDDIEWHPDEGPEWVGSKGLEALFWGDNPLTKMRELGFKVDRWMDRIREWDAAIADDPWDWYGGMDDDELAELAADLMRLDTNLRQEVNKLDRLHRRYNQRMGFDREEGHAKVLRAMDDMERNWVLRQLAEFAEVEKLEVERERARILKELVDRGLSPDKQADRRREFENERERQDRQRQIFEDNPVLGEEAQEVQDPSQLPPEDPADMWRQYREEMDFAYESGDAEEAWAWWMQQAGVDDPYNATPEQLEAAERRIRAGQLDVDVDDPEVPVDVEFEELAGRLQGILDEAAWRTRLESSNEEARGRKEDSYEERLRGILAMNDEGIADMLANREAVAKRLPETQVKSPDVKAALDRDREAEQAERLAAKGKEFEDIRKRRQDILDKHPKKFWFPGQLGGGEDDEGAYVPPEVIADLFPGDDDLNDIDIDEILDDGAPTPLDDDLKQSILDAEDVPEGIDPFLDKMDDIFGAEDDVDFTTAERRREAADEALMKILAGDTPGAFEALARSSIYPDRARCRCGCGGVMPEGAGRGAFINGHDFKERYEMYEAARLGDKDAWAAIEWDPARKRAFQAYAARKHADLRGPELRVEGDERFSEEELAYDPSRIPDGVPFEWEYAPLLDPGPGTKEVQINRLEVRRNRATTPTERGLLNGVLARMRGPNLIDDSPSSDPANVQELVDEIQFKRAMERVLGVVIDWDMVRGEATQSLETLSRLAKTMKTDPADPAGSMSNGELAYFREIVRDIRRQVDFDAPSEGVIAAVRRVIHTIDVDEREVKRIIDGDGLPVVDDSDVGSVVAEKQRETLIGKISPEGNLDLGRLGGIIFGGMGPSRIDQISIQERKSSIAALWHNRTDFDVFAPNGGDTFYGNSLAAHIGAQFVDHLKRNIIHGDKEAYKEWEELVEAARDDVVDESNELEARKKLFARMNEKLDELGFGWAKLDFIDFDGKPQDLGEFFDDEGFERSASSRLPQYHQFFAAWWDKVESGLRFEDNLGPDRIPGQATLPTLERYEEFKSNNWVEGVVYEALLNKPAMHGFLLSKESPYDVGIQRRRRQMANNYQLVKQRRNAVDRQQPPVIRDSDMEVERQPSIADIDDVLSEPGAVIGEPLPIFMEGTLLRGGHFSVQNMVVPGEVSNGRDLRPGQGLVGTARLVDEVEVFEEVEERLRQMGAQVGRSSLGIEGFTPRGREENNELISKLEGLSLSVWIDLGDGKLVEFFPQVSNTKKAVNDIAASNRLVVEDRMGQVDRSVDFPSPDGIAPDAQGLGFRLIPWSRRGSFEFTDMTAAEIEEFLQKVFPNSRHQREIAGNLLFNDRENRRGVPFSIVDGFADGSVVPNLKDKGVVHKFSINRGELWEDDKPEGADLGTGTLTSLIDIMSTWGVLSQAERQAHNRATGEGRNLRRGPEVEALDVKTGRIMSAGGGMSPAGDLASGLDGYVFSSLGSGISYGRGDITFVFDPRHALRDDVLIAPEDFGPSEDRYGKYGAFAQELGSHFGEGYPADKFAELMDGGFDFHHINNEVNIPRGVAWNQVAAVVINDPAIQMLAAVDGLVPFEQAGFEDGATMREVAEIRFGGKEEFDKALNRFRLTMAMLKDKMPDVGIHFNGNFENPQQVKRAAKAINGKSGLGRDELPAPFIGPQNLGESFITSPNRLNEFGPDKVLDHLPQIPGDMKLSEFDPDWDEFDNWTIDQMRELMSAIQGLDTRRYKRKPGWSIKPIKQLDEKISTGDREIDLSAIDMITPENPSGFMPLWFQLDEDVLFDMGVMGRRSREKFMGDIARALRESGKFGDDHPISDMKKTFEERWSIFMRMPFLAWEGAGDIV